MKLSSLLKQSNINKLNLFIGISLILAYIITFWNTIIFYYNFPDPINTFSYSEFLINFQGGFVRRGLSGEILFQLFTIDHFYIVPTITILCFIVYFAVLIFFFYKFYKHKYCWWILLSPLFLGYTHDIIRKDYILYCILIGCLYLLRCSNPRYLHGLCACLLITLGLFLHEAFIFWGFPIYALIILSNQRHKLLNWILIIIPIVVFALLSIFKGTPEIACKIVDSWNLIIPEKPLIYYEENSIGALAWDSQDTFLFHLKRNTSKGGLILIPLYILAAYYMFTNFLSVFSRQSLEKRDNGKFALSLVYSLTAICMIPMLTVLSCDTARNFQYISVVTFATFLIIPQDDIILAFPEWYKRLILNINKFIDSFLPPNKGLLIIMLLFIGMSHYRFSFKDCFSQSVIGSIFRVLISIVL